jgi:hypothetical protein
MTTTMRYHEVVGGMLAIVLSTDHELTELERAELDAIARHCRPLEVSRGGEGGRDDSPGAMWSWEGPVELDVDAILGAI